MVGRPPNLSIVSLTPTPLGRGLCVHAGDYSLLQKMFGATSNNDAKLQAKAKVRTITIETYNADKAKENKVTPHC